MMRLFQVTALSHDSSGSPIQIGSIGRLIEAGWAPLCYPWMRLLLEDGRDVVMPNSKLRAERG
jgi:hypothetical protein